MTEVASVIAEWKTKPLSGSDGNPPPLYGCSLLHVGSRNFFLFGGTGQRSSSELYILSVDSNAWVKAKTVGRAPSPRYFHSACLVDRKMYVFGGYNGSSKLGDLYVLNVDTLEWKPLNDKQLAKSGPKKRHSHAMAGFEGRVFVYGGYGQNRQVFGDVHEFDERQGEWRLVVPHPDGELSRTLLSRSHCPSPKDQRTYMPAPRAGHSMSVVSTANTRAILICGGKNPVSNTVFNDTWFFHTKDRRWEHVEGCGYSRPRAVPAPHSADGNARNLDPNHEFAGVSGHADAEWLVPEQRVTESGAPTLGRPPACGSQVLIFGGSDGDNLSQQTWLFSPQSKEWSSIKTVGELPPARFQHAMAASETCLVLYGGTGAGHLYNTVYMLELTGIRKALMAPFAKVNNTAKRASSKYGRSKQTMSDNSSTSTDQQLYHKFLMQMYSQQQVERSKVEAERNSLALQVSEEETEKKILEAKHQHVNRHLYAATKAEEEKKQIQRQLKEAEDRLRHVTLAKSGALPPSSGGWQPNQGGFSFGGATTSSNVEPMRATQVLNASNLRALEPSQPTVSRPGDGVDGGQPLRRLGSMRMRPQGRQFKRGGTGKLMEALEEVETSSVADLEGNGKNALNARRKRAFVRKKSNPGELGGLLDSVPVTNTNPIDAALEGEGARGLFATGFQGVNSSPAVPHFGENELHSGRKQQSATPMGLHRTTRLGKAEWKGKVSESLHSAVTAATTSTTVSSPVSSHKRVDDLDVAEEDLDDGDEAVVVSPEHWKLAFSYWTDILARKTEYVRSLQEEHMRATAILKTERQENSVKRDTIESLIQQQKKFKGDESTLASLDLQEINRLESMCHFALTRIFHAKQMQIRKEKIQLETEKARKHSCVVCQDRPITCVLIPCRHRCLCLDCASVLSKCPICRGPVKERLETH